MNKEIPTLHIKRRVQNLGQEHIDVLEERLLQEEGSSPDIDISPENIRALFNPVEGMRGAIIDKTEFVRLQRSLGSNMLAETDISALKVRFEEALEDCPDTREVKTLPAQLHQWGKGSLRLLGVANSQGVIAERLFAEKVIAEFLGVESIPKGVLAANKRKASQVWLAYSTDRQTFAALRQLDDVLKNQPDLMPELTQFGGLEVVQSRWVPKADLES